WCGWWLQRSIGQSTELRPWARPAANDTRPSGGEPAPGRRLESPARSPASCDDGPAARRVAETVRSDARAGCGTVQLLEDQLVGRARALGHGQAESEGRALAPDA